MKHHSHKHLLGKPPSKAEEAIRTSMSRMFLKQKKEIIQDLPGLIEDPKKVSIGTEWSKSIVDELRPVILGIYKVGGDKALQSIRKFPPKTGKKGYSGLEVLFSERVEWKARPSLKLPEWLDDPDVLEAIEDEMFDFADNIGENTADSLRDALYEGMENGEGIDELTDRIEELYEGWSGYRAERIARTESARAYSNGHIQAWKKTGVVKNKVWVASPDACPFCLDMNGTVIELEDTFLDKGETQDIEWEGKDISMDQDYSDVEGPPLHPNCRCALVGQLEDEPGEISDGEKSVKVSQEELLSIKGGAGSGNFGHGGRPGQVGGSGEGGGEKEPAKEEGSIPKFKVEVDNPAYGNDGARLINNAFEYRPPEYDQVEKERAEAYAEFSKKEAELHDAYIAAQGGKNVTNEEQIKLAQVARDKAREVEEARKKWESIEAKANQLIFHPSKAKDMSVRGTVAKLPKEANLDALKEYKLSTRYAEYNDKGIDFKTQFNMNVVDTAIDQWSTSSADTSVRSLEMQVAVAREFKLGEKTEVRALMRLDKAYDNPKNLNYKDSPKDHPDHYSLSPSKMEERVAALQVVARAMYNNTQEKLKEMGVDEVVLYRGSSRPGAESYPSRIEMAHEFSSTAGKEVELKGNPVASWSVNHSVATGFTGEDRDDSQIPVIFRTVVPREAIFSTAVTGLGCLEEKEVCVLGVGGPAHAWKNERF